MGMSATISHGTIRRPPPPPVKHGWGGSGPGGHGADRRASFTGLYVLLAATTMVFAAFTAAFVMRRSLSGDWAAVPKPHVLFVNTAILLASSIVLDFSRRALKAGDRSRFNLYWTAATALGVLFLGGQALAWSQLNDAGIYVASTPASSFFYVLTAAHAFHLVGGLGALIYVDVQAWRLRLGPAKRTVIDVSAVFWHFLDGLWLFLMLLIYCWG
jgi:cytochrome c oxidase subunit III